MAYTVDELVDKFRRQMDDVAEPHFWSDETICEMLDEAQREFAIITYIFKGSDSTIVVTADDPYVTFPAELIFPRRAKLASQTRPLSLINMSDAESQPVDDYGLQSSVWNWETVTGTPRLLITDETNGKGRLSPIPTADDTMTLHYFRFPQTAIADVNDTIELQDPRHQLSLLLYARHKAYDDHDVDTYNPQLAEEFYGKFLRKVQSFKSEIKVLQERVRTVKYAGY